VVFGWQSDTQYYYAHLSQDNTIYAHNGIFKVDGKDRERIDDQWDGAVGAPPAVTDEEWHDVRVVRCADSGDVAVYVDGLDTPLLTANDTTFGEGRVGFGSFDNTGSLRDLVVTPAEEPAGVALDVTVAPRCLAGTAYLAVAATNASDVPADVTLTTAFGSRTVSDVQPGAAAYQSFATRATALEAGSVTVTATAVVDGEEASSEVVVEHAAHACG